MIEQPNPRRSSFSETKHSLEIKDPYRWMEDGESDETKEYIDGHNAYSDTILRSGNISKISDKVSTLYPAHETTVPKQYGEFWWWRTRDVDVKTNKETVSFVKSESYDDKSPEAHIKVSDFGPGSSVDFWGCDPTGRYWVGGLQTNGSDWVSVRIYDSEEKKFLKETLEDVKFTFRYTFTKDGSGFFYHTLPSSDHESDGPYGSQMTYFHRLNTDQAEDICFWKEETDALRIPASESVTDDGEYVIYPLCDGVAPKRFVYYSKVTSAVSGKRDAFVVDDTNQFLYEYLGTFNDRWYFYSNRDAGKNNVVSWSKESGFKVEVPERDYPLKDAAVAGSKILLVYMNDASDQLELWSPETGDYQKVETKSKYSAVLSIEGNRKNDYAFATIESFDKPSQVFKIDTKSAQISSLGEDELASDQDFVCERRVYKSTDGTDIGLFVSYFKSAVTRYDPPPVFLYSYGGFCVSCQPHYEPIWLAFMKYYGGILCVANIRGGGENGVEWWEAAQGTKRQVGFDDFKSAARYIVDSGMTTVERLAINGISNGGLLVGASSVQDPQLFGCVICDVGVLDLARFDQFTFGALWKSEYGNPSIKEEYVKLLELSPYNNIETKEFPAFMITTADHDDRVVPGHSLKFSAELIHRNPSNPNPIILRVYKGTGHMIGKSASMVIHETSEKLDFISKALNIDL